MKVALVHHWLTTPGGGERVLYELHKMYPDAPIYTTAYIPDQFPEFAGADIRTTFLNRVPILRHKHQLFPIFLGIPFKTFNMDEYDLVISSCAAEAKYVKTKEKTLHICYCHTPVRYYWSDYRWRLHHMPFGAFNWLARIVFPLLIKLLRRIDYAAAQKVDLFIANSEHVKQRIATYYDRESTVIYPPVETRILANRQRKAGDYYLIFGRQVASKRLDVAVDAFNECKYRLVVAGAGEDMVVQKPRANKNIEFFGRVTDEARDELLAGAKALVFPPEEDFGMVPIEALAAGTPVIAFGAGGALEYIDDGVNGLLFQQQTGGSLVKAIRRFERIRFDESKIRESARRFDAEVFREQMHEFSEKEWKRFRERNG